MGKNRAFQNHPGRMGLLGTVRQFQGQSLRQQTIESRAFTASLNGGGGNSNAPLIAEAQAEAYQTLLGTPHNFGSTFDTGQVGTPLILPGTIELFYDTNIDFMDLGQTWSILFTNPIDEIVVSSHTAGVPVSLGVRQAGQSINLRNDDINMHPIFTMQIRIAAGIIGTGILDLGG